MRTAHQLRPELGADKVRTMCRALAMLQSPTEYHSGLPREQVAPLLATMAASAVGLVLAARSSRPAAAGEVIKIDDVPCEGARTMSENKQRFLLWLSLALMAGYCLALIFLLKMFPPPSPRWSDAQVQEFYRDNSMSIRTGALVASWTGAFLVPFYVVMGIQAARIERRGCVWGVVVGIAGGLMTVFLVFPPIFWGLAAYDPERSADLTVLMHQLGCLTLVTTDQYFLFPWLAVIALCFMQTDARHSAFPRWFGYATAWSLLLFETGAISFWTKSGPFAWDGLLAFWIPFAGFGAWMATAYVLLFRALAAQQRDALDAPDAPHVADVALAAHEGRLTVGTTR